MNLTLLSANKRASEPVFSSLHHTFVRNALSRDVPCTLHPYLLLEPGVDNICHPHNLVTVTLWKKSSQRVYKKIIAESLMTMERKKNYHNHSFSPLRYGLLISKKRSPENWQQERPQERQGIRGTSEANSLISIFPSRCSFFHKIVQFADAGHRLLLPLNNFCHKSIAAERRLLLF